MTSPLKSRTVWLWILVWSLAIASQLVVDAFGVVVSSSSSSPTQLHCICINCKWVTSCSAYHFVETKHEQPHMTENPTFEPRNGSPTIHVNIRTHETAESQQEAQRLWREHEGETKRALERAAVDAAASSINPPSATTTKKKKNNNNNDPKSQPPQPFLYGQEKYNLQPKVTMEYDVVKCEDYVQDMGCWIRHMPDEIRRANPNFIPS